MVLRPLKYGVTTISPQNRKNTDIIFIYR